MTSHPGLGVMLQMLCGNEKSVAAFKNAIGKTIAKAALVPAKTRDKWYRADRLVLLFTDGTGIAFKDDGQSCCESRYMRTDDDLSYFEGAELLDGEIREAPKPADHDEDRDDCHEIQFLVIKTSKGEFTMASHNEHNGYYGGFAIRVSEVE